MSDSHVPEPTDEAGAESAAATGAATPEADRSGAWAEQLAEAGTAGSTRGHRRLLVAGAAAVLVIVAVIVAVGIGGPGNRASAAYIRSVAAHTLSQSTADITISGTVSTSSSVSGSVGFSLNGTGEVDIANHLVDLTMNTQVNGVSVDTTDVMAGGSLYLQFSAGTASISSILPGKSWIEYPLPATPSASATSGPDPLVNLAQLEARGATVTTAGTRVVDGVTVRGYQVVLPHEDTAASIGYLKKIGLSGTSLQDAITTLRSGATPTETLWIDPSTNLVASETVNYSTSLNGAAVTESVTVTFVKYGVAVSVAVPAQSTVATFAQFEAAAKAQG